MEISKTFAISTFVFSAIMILSTEIYYNRPNPYVRPGPYFYLLSVAVGVIAFQILTLKIEKMTKIITFWEIFMVMFSFIVTQQALYKTVLGRDPWTHGALIAQILKIHRIPPYHVIKTPYVWLPNFHLTIVSIMEASGLSYKWATYMLSVSSFVLGLIIAYMLFTRLWNSERVTMLSLLLIGIADNVLSMIGINIIPNSVGVILAFLIFWILLRNTKNDIKEHAVLVFLLFSLSLMHTLSYGFVVTEIMFIIIVLMAFRKNYLVARYFTVLFGISWIIALFVWGIITDFYLKSLTMLLKGLIVGFEVIETYTYRIQAPLDIIILSRAGMLVYFGLVGVGILRYSLHLLKTGHINRSSCNNYWKVTARTSYGMVSLWTALMSFSFLLPPWAGIAHRFWYYGEILGSVFVASTLDKKIKKKIVIVIVVISLAYLMFTSSMSNEDNPIIKEYSTRTGWYDSEIQSALFSLEYLTNKYLASDWDYISSLNSLSWTKIEYTPRTTPKLSGFGWVLKAKFPGNFDEITEDTDICFILRRELISNYTFWLGPRWGMVRYPPVDKHEYVIYKVFINKDVIYDSKTVQIIL